jgi:hypothetical protein
MPDLSVTAHSFTRILIANERGVDVTAGLPGNEAVTTARKNEFVMATTPT